MHPLPKTMHPVFSLPPALLVCVVVRVSSSGGPGNPVAVQTPPPQGIGRGKGSWGLAIRQWVESPVCKRQDREGCGEAGGDNRRGSVSGRLGGTSVVLTVPTLPFRPGLVPTPHGPHGRRPAPGEQQQHGGHWLQLLPGLR